MLAHALDRQPRALMRVTRFAAALGLALLLDAPLPVAAGKPPLVGAPHVAAPQHDVRDLGRGPAEAKTGSGRAFAPGVVLVGFGKHTGNAEKTAARLAAHATAHRAISPRAKDVERLTLPSGASVDAAIKALKGSAGVRFAEPDYVITIDHTPNDPLYAGGYMWNLEGPTSNPSTTYGAAAAEAWDHNQVGSRDVLVGIVDTGVDINHKDLQANIWTNPFETPGNGIDDDGNGYIDDVHGWDFFHNDASVFDSTAADFHGTHVAGTIGGVGSNSEGLVGVNWAVTMIPAKFIDGEGTVSGAVAALDYLTDLKTRHGLNIVATNNSWGDPEDSVALQDAINRGGDAGILFVAAAGNSSANIDVTPSYPAANTCDTRFDDGTPRGYDCLISVAAIDDTGAKASFSNYGATSVDIGAPGQQVASTYPGGQYAYLSGTSMAAPHVTGAIALLASCQATPAASALRQSVLSHGVATASLAGITVTGDRIEIGDMMADCDTGGPPRLLLTAQAGGTDTPAVVQAWFSEPVTGFDASDVGIGGTSTGWSVTDFSGNIAQTLYSIDLQAASPPGGTLSITIQANSLMGVSQPGPAAAAAFSLIVDRSSPMVAAPKTSIRSGTSLSGAAIPVRVSWTASDTGSGVHYATLWYSVNGSAFAKLASFVLPYVDVFLNPSGTIRFEVRVWDWAGHASSMAVGPVLSPRLVQQGGLGVTYSGFWALAHSSSYSGGSARHTSVAKRSATYSFTGRSIGFVTTLASNRGVVYIKLDGATVAKIDLGTAATTYRRIVWSRTFSAVKAHRLQIIVVGTYGRVDVDAFAVLK